MTGARSVLGEAAGPWRASDLGAVAEDMRILADTLVAVLNLADGI
jgi:hypothetical protein